MEQLQNMQSCFTKKNFIAILLKCSLNYFLLFSISLNTVYYIYTCSKSQHTDKR